MSEQYKRIGIMLLFLIGKIDLLIPNSLVYNLRIRRALMIGQNWHNNTLFKNMPQLKVFLTALPITSHRTRDIQTITPAVNVSESSNINGAILNLRFKPNKRWWLELTTGLEKETARFWGTKNFCVSRTGLDDFVITSGVNMYPSTNTQFVLYGMAGFPTKLTVSPLQVFNTPVGTRFYNLGLGAEISYAPINLPEQSLTGVFQTRFLHFFNRSWTPILPAGSQIQPGNATDLLFTIQYRKMVNIFECGYNPTFFNNLGTITPNGFTAAPSFVRHGFYATFSHAILNGPLNHKPLIVGLGTNYSFSKKFNTQICAAWISLTASF